MSAEVIMVCVGMICMTVIIVTAMMVKNLERNKIDFDRPTWVSKTKTIRPNAELINPLPQGKWSIEKKEVT